MVIKIGKKLMDALRALVYEIFLETFLEREKKINVLFNGFLYFSRKWCQNSKLYLNSLLTHVLKAPPLIVL